MSKSTFTRRRFLATTATSAATIAMRSVRGADAAGKLAVGFWDHWVPGANAVLAALALYLALFGMQASAYAQAPLQRGDYLVNAVMACDGCHTPSGSNGPVMERRFSGGPQTWKTPAYSVKGSNITPDQETGIGTWTAEDVKRSLTDGVRPTGVPLSPQMPYAFYKS